MSIAAKRHKFLDKETMLGTHDLRDIKQNDIYTAAVDKIETGLDAFKLDSFKLNTLATDVASVANTVNNMSDSALRGIQRTLDSTINGLMDSVSDGFVKKVVSGLQGLSPGGVREFLTTAVKAGTNFVCNNLDMIKNMALGFTLSKNILSGLLLGLALGWLDRFCKSFSQAEWQNNSNLGLLEDTFGKEPMTLSSNNVVETFGKAVSGVANRASGPSLETLPNTTTLINKAKAGTIDVSTMDVELSDSSKRSIISSVDTALSGVAQNGPEYNNLLKLRGDVHNVPSISDSRRFLNQETKYSGEVLGNVLINLKDVDIPRISRTSITDEEVNISDRLTSVKKMVDGDRDLISRVNAGDTFDGYDWTPILNELGSSTLEEFKQLPSLPEAYNANSIHPTAAVFIEDSVPDVAIKESPSVNGVVYA